VYSARIQSFHLVVAHLRCFDARLARPDGLVKFNRRDRYNDFIKGVRRVPPYTDLFWAMFYKIAPFLGGIKKIIIEAKTAEDVDAIRKMKVRGRQHSTSTSRANSSLLKFHCSAMRPEL
jgi:hypothetical protein